MASVTVGGVSNDKPPQPLPSRGTGEVRAVVKAGRKKLEVVRRFNKLYANRGRLEDQTLVTDQIKDFERHSWLHAPSGEEHTKSGRLSDPGMHGKASAARIRMIIRKPTS